MKTTSELNLEEEREPIQNKNAEKLKKLEDERDELKMTQLTVTHDLNVAKEKLNQVERQLTEKEEELTRQERQIEQMKDRLTKSEQSKIELTQDLATAKAEIHKFRSRCQTLDKEYTQFRSEHVQTMRTIEKQSDAIADLEREKEELHYDVKEKQRKIVELQGYIQHLKSESQRTQADLLNFREQVDMLNHHLSMQENDYKRLQQEAKMVVSERDNWAGQCQKAEEEIRNITADLSTMTKENQVLNSELADLASERDTLRHNMDQGAQQLTYFNELLVAKEQERDQILATYRKLISEHEKLESGLKFTGDESNSLRMECLVKEKNIQQLEKTVQELITETKQLKYDLNEYEKQCNNLTRTLATVERDLRTTEIDKAKLLREITASREMSLKLDKSKENLQKTIANLTMENDKLRNEVRDSDVEKEILLKRMNNEVAKIGQLEKLVALERTKKMQTDKSKKDLENAKETLEGQVQTITSKQNSSISNLLAEIKSHVEDKQKLNSKIEELEELLTACRQEIQTKQEDSEKLRKELQRFQLQLKEKEKVTGELLSEKSDASDESLESINKTAFERKILSELEETKRQLKKYEIQIAKRYKEGKKKFLHNDDAAAEGDIESESTDDFTDDLIDKWKSQNEAIKMEIANLLPGKRSTAKFVEPDRKQRQLEEENRRLMHTIMQVQEDLGHQTTTSSSPEFATSHQASLSLPTTHDSTSHTS